MQAESLQVSRLFSADAPHIIAAFCDAFRDYPVMRYVAGGPEETYEERLHRLISLFVMARVLRNEPILGIWNAGTLCATATMSQPADTTVPAGFEALKAETWAALGPEARARYDLCTAAWDTLSSAQPHMHLNMIGVRREWQGFRLGRLLLEEVQQISRNTPGSRGVSLTTEISANVKLYQHIGYEVTGHVEVSAGLETWALFRHG